MLCLYSQPADIHGKITGVKKKPKGEKTPVITADGFVSVSFGLTRTEPVFAHVSYRRRYYCRGCRRRRRLRTREHTMGLSRGARRIDGKRK